MMTIGLSAVPGSSLLTTSGKLGVADVPFSFRIADRSNGLMELWNTDTQQGMMFVAGSNVPGKSDPKPVFNHRGGRYFPSQVWFADQNSAPCRRVAWRRRSPAP